jgi:hypothetical protein
MGSILLGLVGWAAAVCPFILGQEAEQQARDRQLDYDRPALSVIGFSTSAAGDRSSDASQALALLDLPPLTRSMVELMWVNSVTFRRQCGRLADAGVTVKFMLEQPSMFERSHATSTIDLRAGAVRSVFVRLRRVEPQYLAHELEHVLELIDGVDLRRAVASRVAGAHESSPGVFETTRAIAIGRLVAEEMGGNRR